MGRSSGHRTAEMDKHLDTAAEKAKRGVWEGSLDVNDGQIVSTYPRRYDRARMALMILCSRI